MKNRKKGGYERHPAVRLLSFLLSFPLLLNAQIDCGQITADLNLNDVNLICEGDTIVAFNNTLSDFSYFLWDWGDGTVDTVYTTDPQNHIYSFSGEETCSSIGTEYPITLTAVLECPEGLSTHFNASPIFVLHQARAEFTMNEQAFAGEAVPLENLSCNADTWLWDFGDGSTSEAENPGEHIYASPGFYWVSLTVSNDCGTETTTQQLQVTEVMENPVGFHLGTANALPGVPICIPVTVSNFDAVAGFQFSLAWEAGSVSDVSVNNNVLEDVGLISTVVTEGGMALLLFSNCNNTVSLEEEATVFELCLTPEGMVGDSLKINFSSLPVSPVIAQCPDGNLEQSVPVVTPAYLVLTAPLQIDSVQITPPLCTDGTDGSITLEISSGASPYTYTWSPTTDTTAVITDLSAGVYTVTVTDATGAIVIDSFAVNNPLPLAIAVQTPDLTCPQPTGQVQITAGNGTAPFTYTVNNTTNTQGIFADFGAGMYAYEVEDAEGCLAQGTFTVDSLLLPEVSIVGDTFSCTGQILLQAIGGGGELTWTFNGDTLSQNESLLVALQSGSYALSLTNADDCTATAETSIVVTDAVSLELSLSQMEPCVGDTLRLEPSGNGSGNYLWLSENIEFDSAGAAFLIGTQEGFSNIILTAETDGLCETDTLVQEVFFTEPMGYVMPDVCIKEGQTLTLTAYEGETYQWEETAYPVFEPQSAVTSARPAESTIYRVEITDSNNCSVTDSVTVEVVGNPIKSIRTINFISPNGDGENDFLVFERLQKYNISDLRVFNRNGSEVFSALNYQNDWGGTYKGEVLPSGNYYYILTVEGEQIKSELTIASQ